jgi:hypothetical protein
MELSGRLYMKKDASRMWKQMLNVSSIAWLLTGGSGLQELTYSFGSGQLPTELWLGMVTSLML